MKIMPVLTSKSKAKQKLFKNIPHIPPYVWVVGVVAILMLAVMFFGPSREEIPGPTNNADQTNEAPI
ncbi:MAG: hypothetical protein Q8N81_08350, partial [bacterium]|nr:hypothetical protein [bacterium]